MWSVLVPLRRTIYVLNKGSGRRLKLFPNGEGSHSMKLETVGGKWVDVKVDSAADESVCPDWWLGEFGTTAPTPKMTCRGANGARMGHLGERPIKAVLPF